MAVSWLETATAALLILFWLLVVFAGVASSPQKSFEDHKKRFLIYVANSVGITVTFVNPSRNFSCVRLPKHPPFDPRGQHPCPLTYRRQSQKQLKRSQVKKKKLLLDVNVLFGTFHVVRPLRV